MAIHSTNQALTASQRIYGWLLHAYPKAHREEYGAAMAQLFRDQGRDAWSESQIWGLTKLWLRVFPDLVSTSIWERFIALNKRKSMNDKIAGLTHDRTTPTAIFIRVALAVFLVTVIAATLITFILPETYDSTARIKVIKDDAASDGIATASDPYFIQTQFEIIKSEVVLQPVLEKLHLIDTWGKKYSNGETLNTYAAIDILKKRLDLRPISNTTLISVTVYSDDPNEAAQIANAVAESYSSYRHAAYLKAHPELDPRMPVRSLAQITDLAEPGRAPVRPNKTLNLLLGVVAGGFLGLLAGGASALAVAKLGIRGRKNVAST